MNFPDRIGKGIPFGYAVHDRESMSSEFQCAHMTHWPGKTGVSFIFMSNPQYLKLEFIFDRKFLKSIFPYMLHIQFHRF